jgi:hypothetical protein
MELDRSPALEEGVVVPSSVAASIGGFNSALYLELVGDMSDGQVSTMPTGGVNLVDRWNPLTRHTRGSFNPEKERIRLITRNISSLWTAGEVLAHETRHFIDWSTGYPGTESYPNYSLAQLSLGITQKGSAVYAASTFSQELLDRFGVDIGQFPGSSFGQVMACTGLVLATIPARRKVYDLYYWNNLEHRARMAGMQWGRKMEKVLADTNLW